MACPPFFRGNDMKASKKTTEYAVSFRDLFVNFFKIGLFTFGGGYAMISVMNEELCQKKKWITNEEMLDMVALSESTPGPVAINAATNIGYRLRGIPGALVATGAEILPAFIIMFVLSFFLDAFMQIPIISSAFKGIQCAVVVLILRAGYSLLKGLKRTPLSLCIVSAVTLGLLLIHIFAWNFSSLLFIVFAACIGLVFGLVSKKEKEDPS